MDRGNCGCIFVSFLGLGVCVKVVLKANLASATNRENGYAVASGTWAYQMCDFIDRVWNLAVHRQSVIATTLAILALLVQKVGTGLLHAGNTLLRLVWKKTDTKSTPGLPGP